MENEPIHPTSTEIHKHRQNTGDILCNSYILVMLLPNTKLTDQVLFYNELFRKTKERADPERI